MFFRKKKNVNQVEKNLIDRNNLFDMIKPYSMSSVNVLHHLAAITADVQKRNIQGDFVECGVYNGGSAAAVSSVLKLTENRAWLFDSFEGMPDVTPQDGEFAKIYVGKSVGKEEMVKKALKLAGFKEEKTIIRKGWFSDTFKLELPEKVSILHVDCDWYESVMLSLRTFYDKVEDGGVIIIDDYGHFEGSREALFDFIQEKKIMPLFERFGHSQIFWIKNRQHNRDFASGISEFSKHFHSNS